MTVRAKRRVSPAVRALRSDAVRRAASRGETLRCAEARRAAYRDVKGAGDHPSVVDAPGAGLVPRQMRLDRRPRLIRQPEQRHAPPPVIHTIRESGELLRLKPLIGFEP